MTLSPGTRLGPYEILAPLGAGGMGEVYRARDTRLGRDVAVKVLPAAFSVDPDRLRRFEQEARAASALNHPNILAIYDVGEQEGSPYVVSELLEGETLREKLAASALLPRKATECALQIARGLAAAHEKGIVHRDLKPENLFVTKDGHLKILDFGLAKLTAQRRQMQENAEAPTVPAHTESGIILGTAGYMSPEQVRGQSVDHRSDIFSFGSILYEMLTGRRAFRGDSAIETMSTILKEEPPEISESGRSIPHNLERIVRRSLEKSPEERFQSARDITFALEETFSGSAVSPAGAAEMVSPSRRLRRVAWFAAGVMVFVVALIAVNAAGLRERLFGKARAGPIQSLAVLPLENLSGDPEQEYFADGMTEALIADLAKIGALRVISRTSVMRYKGARRRLPEIARELDVDAVIEGSVMRSGGRVRITAQLVHARTDRHLWAESYERELRDVLDLQREVARAVAAQIEVKITPREHAGLAAVRRVDPETYHVYLKGRYHWNKRNAPAILKGIEYFEEALEKDPAYAAAYAGLADSYIVLASYGAVPPVEWIPRAEAAARKALEIDTSLAEARASLAWVIHRYHRDFLAGESEFRLSIEQNPNYATAHHWYGLSLAAMGRHAEALRELEQARRLDPLSLIINTNLGWVLYYERRYGEAIEQYRKTLELDPGFSIARWKLRQAYERRGQHREAFAELEKTLDLWGREDLLAAFREDFRKGGYPAVLRRWVRDYEESSKSQYVGPYEVALLYAELGEKDEAFDWLEKACAERSVEAVFTKVEPDFDPLRSDPRFADLLRCLGLAG